MQGDAAEKLTAWDYMAACWLQDAPGEDAIADMARMRGGDAGTSAEEADEGGDNHAAEQFADQVALALHEGDAEGALFDAGDAEGDEDDEAEEDIEDAATAAAERAAELDQELYKDANVTVGQALYGLGRLKADGRMLNGIFEMLLKFLYFILPSGNLLPRWVPAILSPGLRFTHVVKGLQSVLLRVCLHAECTSLWCQLCMLWKLHKLLT